MPSLRKKPSADLQAPPQQVVKVRRDYNTWVANETLEDYALRYTPQRFRKWSTWRVGNTAFGVASFLVLEAVGATLLVQYGWTHAFWAILVTGLLIFAAGLPISVYAARYGVDMDLLTRGAGFGYIGSTITSLIYASFTFIFFALEAAVMAYALELALGIPPSWGYLLCALVVVPLVMHGISAISRLQTWTQPLWLLMLVVPFAAVAFHNPQVFTEVLQYGGGQGDGTQFQWLPFGAALTVGIALITQMGEQADYLRFMPPAQQGRRLRWWWGVLVGGPGWVVLGVAKMLGGALLAYLAISRAVPPKHAVDPNQMYLAAYEYVFSHYGWAVAATALFVVVSQIKINVTNAYAGSLAWSNFFSRLTHSHPGRVVWVVFNTLIAFMLMEMDVFRALGQVLGLYSNLAIAWIMAVVADLVINKPLGLSPKGIEFKRAHLYDINPVGVGAMALASLVSVAAHLGAFGALPQAFSAVIAMIVALLASPLIAWATRGRYYLARQPVQWPACQGCSGCGTEAERRSGEPVAHTLRCTVCERWYEAPDMAQCPAYGGAICSLCCTLDVRCSDVCKPHARWSVQWLALLRRVLPRRWWGALDKGLGHFVLLMLLIAPTLGGICLLFYQQELQNLALRPLPQASLALVQQTLASGMRKVYFTLLLVACVAVWWLVLVHQSRQVAQNESRRQTRRLVREIERHRQTDQALQQARQAAEAARQVAEDARVAADQANQAKSRYISTISHELRTPLNAILGYAQLMAQDAARHPALPPRWTQAVQTIQRGGEHLLSLIDGTLDIARIESGKLMLATRPMALAQTLREVASLMQPQADAKGLQFHMQLPVDLPAQVRGDEQRVRQILLNLVGNAIKFTVRGSVTVSVRYAREMAQIEVRDTGPGLTPAEQERLFEPFMRGAQGSAGAPGAGLGLTIARMLTELMGGELGVRSTPGQGATFMLRLYLPVLHQPMGPAPAPLSTALPPDPVLLPTGYLGAPRKLLVVDNEEADREVMRQLLLPLGFEVRLAADGQQALDVLDAGYAPDAVLLDLAMPVLDGWQTLERIRQREGGAQLHCAIVSANAFDRNLPNAVGITPEDFIVKPVRHRDLLRWLEQRLELVWTHAPAPAPLPEHVAPAAAPAPSVPPAPALQGAAAWGALRRALQRGHAKGVQQALAALMQAQALAPPLAAALRPLADTYQWDAMLALLDAQTDTVPPGETHHG